MDRYQITSEIIQNKCKIQHLNWEKKQLEEKSLAILSYLKGIY